MQILVQITLQPTVYVQAKYLLPSFLCLFDPDLLLYLLLFILLHLLLDLENLRLLVNLLRAHSCTQFLEQRISLHELLRSEVEGLLRCTLGIEYLINTVEYLVVVLAFLRVGIALFGRTLRWLGSRRRGE